MPQFRWPKVSYRSGFFEESLSALRQHHADRFALHHHVDSESGVVTAAQINDFISATVADFYVCGPGPYMDTVEKTLLTAGVSADRLPSNDSRSPRRPHPRPPGAASPKR